MVTCGKPRNVERPIDKLLRVLQAATKRSECTYGNGGTHAVASDVGTDLKRLQRQNCVAVEDRFDRFRVDIFGSQKTLRKIDDSGQTIRSFFLLQTRPAAAVPEQRCLRENIQ